MRTLKTSEAAAALNVSPNTLRSWERRFGFPRPQRTAGQHRLYAAGEVAALRDALREGLSIASAISRAREALSTDTGALAGALASLDTERADAAMEGALALRSLERSVETVLLPALDELANRLGPDSASVAFASRWASEWLQRAKRLAPPPVRPLPVLIGDATGEALDADAIGLAALELFLVRAGGRVLVLPVGRLTGLNDIVGRLEPRALIVAGRSAGDDEVGRWVYRVRGSTGPVHVGLFRRGSHGARTTAKLLGDAPALAVRTLLDELEPPRVETKPVQIPGAAHETKRRVAG